LLTVPAPQRTTISFERELRVAESFHFTTLKSRKARKDGATGGLIGMLIGQSIASSSEATGRKLQDALRETSNRCEAPLLSGSIETHLRSAGVQLVPPDREAPRLKVNIVARGLAEVVPGHFSAHATVASELFSATGRRLWSARVQSVATVKRPVAEFQSRPEQYRDDFAEVADDLARQLVQGPIRPMGY
jgi:hypothetical protein